MNPKLFSIFYFPSTLRVTALNMLRSSEIWGFSPLIFVRALSENRHSSASFGAEVTPCRKVSRMLVNWRRKKCVDRWKRNL